MRLPLDGEIAYCFYAGLRAVELLRKHEPAFYAAEAAGEPVTLPRLLGAAAAFFQLTQQRGLELRWPSDDVGYHYGTTLEDTIAETPAETLRGYDDVSEEWFSGALARFIHEPHPHYYGIGVHDVVENGYDISDPLTIALWRLFDHTPWSVGIDFETFTDFRSQPRGVAEVLASIRSLPHGAPLAEICAAVAAEVPESAGLRTRGMLIRYALAQTGNQIADHSNEELDEVWGGDDLLGLGWDDIPRMVELSQEARAVREAYEAWSRRVTSEGAPAIEALVTLFHRRHRAIQRAEQRSARTASLLTHVLTDQPADAEPVDYASLIEAL